MSRINIKPGRLLFGVILKKVFPLYGTSVDRKNSILLGDTGRKYSLCRIFYPEVCENSAENPLYRNGIFLGFPETDYHFRERVKLKMLEK